MVKGVVKIEHDVFHFPPARRGELSDFYKPHDEVSHEPGGPSLTRQDFAEECDINAIMERYQHTGVLPAGGEPFYYDFTTLPTTMMESMDVMRQATDAFMTLPAKVRREFDNDPAEFVDFASNPDNVEQMREWGLAEPKKALPVPQEPAPAAPSQLPASPAPAPGPASAGPAQSST